MLEHKAPPVDQLLSLRIIWGALIFSCLIYGFIAQLIAGNYVDEIGEITTFNQAMQTKEFFIFVVTGIVFVAASRLVPKIIFKSLLKKNVITDKQQVLKLYLPGFVVGLVFLEFVATLGFIHTLKYHYLPVYYVFGFVAAANMIIRFPTWSFIKFLSEDSLQKPLGF